MAGSVVSMSYPKSDFLLARYGRAPGERARGVPLHWLPAGTGFAYLCAYFFCRHEKVCNQIWAQSALWWPYSRRRTHCIVFILFFETSREQDTGLAQPAGRRRGGAAAKVCKVRNLRSRHSSRTTNETTPTPAKQSVHISVRKSVRGNASEQWVPNRQAGCSPAPHWLPASGAGFADLCAHFFCRPQKVCNQMWAQSALWWPHSQRCIHCILFILFFENQ